LAFGVKGVEGQGGLARTGQPGDDGEPVARDLDIDVFQVVLAGAPDDDSVECHASIGSIESISVDCM
jgi:hypothetical protein